MELIAKYTDGTKFEVAARDHRLICDQPLDNGGDDAGFTPPEFLLASLATCAAYYTTQYLKARSISCEGLKVKVSAEKAAQPARIGSFQIDVIAPELDPAHEAGVLRAVPACLIHNTLLHAPQIEVSLLAQCPAPAG